MPEQILLMPALLFGAIIGLLELFFIHADENFKGSHWLSHGLHAVVIAIIGVFAAMNLDYVLALFPALKQIPYISNLLLWRIAIGLIITIKTYTISAVVAGAKGRGMHEKLWHCLIIGFLVAISAYVYPILEPILPAFLK